MARPMEMMMNKVASGDDGLSVHTARRFLSVMMGLLSDTIDRTKTTFFNKFGYFVVIHHHWYRKAVTPGKNIFTLGHAFI